LFFTGWPLSYIKTRAPPFKDTFEMQVEAIRRDQTVIVVDDLLATGMFPSRLRTIMAEINQGGSAKSAGELVAQLGGVTLEYLFIVEVAFLKGSSQLDAPVYSIEQLHES
jgi:adenine phosphoribosyltransferase